MWPRWGDQDHPRTLDNAHHGGHQPWWASSQALGLGSSSPIPHPTQQAPGLKLFLEVRPEKWPWKFTLVIV
jgi:hypothetical protein